MAVAAAVHPEAASAPPPPPVQPLPPPPAHLPLGSSAAHAPSASAQPPPAPAPAPAPAATATSDQPSSKLDGADVGRMPVQQPEDRVERWLSSSLGSDSLNPASVEQGSDRSGAAPRASSPLAGATGIGAASGEGAVLSWARVNAPASANNNCETAEAALAPPQLQTAFAERSAHSRDRSGGSGRNSDVRDVLHLLHVQRQASRDRTPESGSEALTPSNSGKAEGLPAHERSSSQQAMLPPGNLANLLSAVRDTLNDGGAAGGGDGHDDTNDTDSLSSLTATTRSNPHNMLLENVGGSFSQVAPLNMQSEEDGPIVGDKDKDGVPVDNYMRKQIARFFDNVSIHSTSASPSDDGDSSTHTGLVNLISGHRGTGGEGGEYKGAPEPENEQERHTHLCSLNVLSTTAEGRYDRLTNYVARVRRFSSSFRLFAHGLRSCARVLNLQR